jgi:hypothetical protein
MNLVFIGNKDAFVTLAFLKVLLVLLSNLLLSYHELITL